MTEQQPTDHEVNVRMHVYRILDQHLDRAFEELDHLHKRGITDTDVVTAMRHGGYESEARAYIEWGGLQDPDLADVNNTTTNPDAVTDPGDSPSYAEHPLRLPPLATMPGAELVALDHDYREKLYTDPVFAAKSKIINNVLTELERIGRRDWANGYSGYMVAAALDRATSVQPEYRHLVQAQLHEAKHLAEHALSDVRHGYGGPLEVSAVMVPVRDLERIKELVESVEGKVIA